jgi:hypothetical protein
MKRFTMIWTFALLVALCAGGIARADEQKDSDVQKERQQAIRRLSLDIAGREPTEQGIHDLTSDGSADAYRKAVEHFHSELRDKRVQLDLDKQAKELADAERAIILSYSAADAHEPRTYMGVGVETPGDTLRAQLKLPKGVGLVVNYIDPNGPSKELIHQHDVLEKLDDQLLINGEQFATLVRMHKQGDSIAVSFIREAKHIQVTVRLGEKGSEQSSNGQPLELDATTASLTPAIARRAALSIAPANLSDELFRVRQTGPVTFDDGSTIAVLQRVGEQSLLTAFDRPSGKLIYSGPLSNDQDWKNVPEDLRQKLNNWRGLTGTNLLEVYGNGSLSVGSNGSMMLSGENIVVGRKQPATQPADKK